MNIHDEDAEPTFKRPVPSASSAAAWWAAVHSGDVACLKRRLAEEPALVHLEDPVSSHCPHLLLHSHIVARSRSPPLSCSRSAVKSGRRGLFLCALRGDTACLALLLQRGSEVDARDAHGQTALMKAALNDHSACVTALLSSSASPSARSPDSDTALLLAAQHDAGAAVRALCCHPSNAAEPNTRGGPPHSHTPLIRAASHGCLCALAALLALPALLVEARDGTGATALVAACKTGNLEVARVLRGAGAAVEVRDGEGDGPLTWAAWAGWEAVVRWGVGDEGGMRGQVDDVDAMGDSALCKAARMGHVGCVRALLEEGGARVDDRSVEAAVRMSHDDCIAALMAARAVQQAGHSAAHTGE